MKTMTVEDIMKHNPCYKRERIIELWAGRESLSFSDVAKLDIPDVDKIWAGVYCYMDDRQRRLFAVQCARRALSRVVNPDPLSVAACDVAERFANGEATLDELSAARDAARDAAMSAEFAESAAWPSDWSATSAANCDARSSAEFAASYAARSAARSAARFARSSAMDAERAQQVVDIEEVMR